MKELIVWKAVRGEGKGESCCFGAHGPAKAWAGKSGRVEEIRVKATTLTLVEDDSQQSVDIAELAMLVARLALSLRKAAPANELSEKAMDYLKRHGLQGRVLRADNGGAVRGFHTDKALSHEPDSTQ